MHIGHTVSSDRRFGAARAQRTSKGGALVAGHFMPEELPEAAGAALRCFMTATPEATT